MKREEARVSLCASLLGELGTRRPLGVLGVLGALGVLAGAR